MNVAIACGGTGGHLFPGLAVAEQLRQEGHAVLLLVSKKDIDQHALDRDGRFPVVRIPAIGLPRRKCSFAMAGFLVRFAYSILACQFLYMKHGIDVVLGMGGFTSAPALLGAQLHFLPTVVHESNSIPGKANRWAGRRAKFAACGFEACVSQFPPGRGVWTGTPVRTSLVELPKIQCLEQLLLDPLKPTVLIMGGSQGAHALNQAAMAAWPQYKDFNVIHLTGVEDFDVVKAVYLGAGAPVRVEPFLREMQLAYGAADIVVSRAGAASLTEIGRYRLPNILVPYPLAAEQHQLRNAEIVANAGAGQILSQDDLNGEQLAKSVQTLWRDSNARRRMSERWADLSKPNAAEEVVQILKRAAKFEPVAQPSEAMV